MKLLKTIRADRSDTFIFEKAARPGEWAVSGTFMFAQQNPASLTGKPRAAFRGGFLGIDSLGWSTLVQVVEANETSRTAAIESLATKLVAHFGAPDQATALCAAEEEISFAASLCDHAAGMLIAVSRRFETNHVYEAFRTLQSGARWKQAPVFSFVETSDGEVEPDKSTDPMARAKSGLR